MGNLSSLILYISIYIASSVLFFISNKYRKKTIYWFSLILPTLLSTFRYGVGTDFFTYYNIYSVQKNMDIKSYIYQSDRYYEFINFFINKIGGNFNSFNLVLFIYAFFTMYFFSKGLLSLLNEKEASMAYSILLLTYYNSSFNTMRQILALSIIFYTIKFIFNQSKKFYIYLLLAIFIHASAVIFLPMYILWNNLLSIDKGKINYKSILKFFLIVFFMILFVVTVTYMAQLDQYKGYLTSTEILRTDNKTFYIKLGKLFVVLILSNYLIKKSKLNKLYICCLGIGVLFNILGFYNVFLKRVSIYFDVTELLLISQIPYMFKNMNVKMMIKGIILGMYVFIYVYTIFILKQMDIIPYQFKIIT